MHTAMIRKFCESQQHRVQQYLVHYYCIPIKHYVLFRSLCFGGENFEVCSYFEGITQTD